MTPPNVKRHLVCPTHGEYEIEVGDNERCYICGVLGEPICACGCRSSLSDFRSDAVYRSEACAKRLQRRGRPDIDPTEHPLQTPRAQQEQADLKSKLSQIIYQGIVDRLKYGPVHADDLEPLFPEERRSMCRRLVGAQFGSLASRGYIVERERRKSKVKSRKGAKSGVYEFTRKGRATLVGNSAGGRGGASSGAGAVPGEKAASGVSTPQGASRALTVPSSAAPGDCGSEGSPSSAPSEPARLFDDAPPSPYDPYSEAA